ncbi:MAG TPA: hypothetical protein VEK57_07330 [Thermoanaerobaculia bacterium]|nr:hypothetical protein [Thermoanaerobaculia bacterium]
MNETLFLELIESIRQAERFIALCGVITRHAASRRHVAWPNDGVGRSIAGRMKACARHGLNGRRAFSQTRVTSAHPPFTAVDTNASSSAGRFRNGGPMSETIEKAPTVLAQLEQAIDVPRDEPAAALRELIALAEGLFEDLDDYNSRIGRATNTIGTKGCPVDQLNAVVRYAERVAPYFRYVAASGELINPTRDETDSCQASSSARTRSAAIATARSMKSSHRTCSFTSSRWLTTRGGWA